MQRVPSQEKDGSKPEDHLHNYVCANRPNVRTKPTRSAVYIRKRTGPSTEPRGTPYSRNVDRASVPWTETCWLLYTRQILDANQFNATPRIPKLTSNRLSRIARSTVSKAALRSNMPNKVICHLSIAVSTSETTLSTAVSVEKTAYTLTEQKGEVHSHSDR